jgi:hypothetical protein
MLDAVVRYDSLLVVLRSESVFIDWKSLSEKARVLKLSGPPRREEAPDLELGYPPLPRKLGGGGATTRSSALACW